MNKLIKKNEVRVISAIEDDLWGDTSHMSAFAIKKEEVAANLTALMVFCNRNRSYISSMTGWSRSRVTNVLSGDMNLTLKTLWEFTSALGYNFDIALRDENQTPANQPWIRKQKPIRAESSSYIVKSKQQAMRSILVQTSWQVASDLKSGIDRGLYFSVLTEDSLNTTRPNATQLTYIENSASPRHQVKKSESTHYIKV